MFDPYINDKIHILCFVFDGPFLIVMHYVCERTSFYRFALNMSKNVISKDYARSRAGQYTSRDDSNSMARYEHIESCVAVH